MHRGGGGVGGSAGFIEKFVVFSQNTVEYRNNSTEYKSANL